MRYYFGAVDEHSIYFDDKIKQTDKKTISMIR